MLQENQPNEAKEEPTPAGNQPVAFPKKIPIKSKPRSFFPATKSKVPAIIASLVLLVSVFALSALIAVQSQRIKTTSAQSGYIPLATLVPPKNFIKQNAGFNHTYIDPLQVFALRYPNAASIKTSESDAELSAGVKCAEQTAQEDNLGDLKLTIIKKEGASISQIWKSTFNTNFNKNSYDSVKEINGLDAYYFSQNTGQTTRQVYFFDITLKSALVVEMVTPNTSEGCTPVIDNTAISPIQILSNVFVSKDANAGTYVSLVKVEVSGGLCPDNNVCQTSYLITKLGEVFKDDKQTETLDNDELSKLSDLVQNADYDSLKSNKFTGTCPTAFDGQEFTFTFYPNNTAEELSSCQYVIDKENLLFKQVIKLLSL